MTANDKRYSEEPKFKLKNIHSTILSWDKTNFIANDSILADANSAFSLGGQYLFQKSAGTDTIFKQLDKEFLFQQFNAIKDTVWHDSFSKSKLLKSKSQRKTNLYHYSIPLFSVDRKYLIIRREYYCGSLCAHGGYYVYRKTKDNEWEYLTSVNTWIS